jgi:hypothetical protein
VYKTSGNFSKKLPFGIEATKAVFTRRMFWMIAQLYYFLFAKKSAFSTQINGNFAEKVIIILIFEKNANFSAENWQKSQKIVIITSVPD